MEISVVVPVYGCREALPELHRRLECTLETITTEYEIILVNDNCPQNSWEVIEELCSSDTHVVGVELSRNHGQMKAIQAGLDLSKGEWVVVMDCDLQDRPEEIGRLYEKAKEGFDVVFARRAHRSDSPFKIFMSGMFYKVYHYATGVDYDGAVSNFSIARRVVIDALCSMREEHRDYSTYIYWLGFKRAVIDVEHDPRYEGKSSYSFKKRMGLALEILTSQSDKILKLFVKLGMLMSFASFIAIIILVINYFTNDVEMGWTSIIATMALIGGIIVMVVGVVGLYVGNTFMQSKNRPLYYVRQILNQKDKDDGEA